MLDNNTLDLINEYLEVKPGLQKMEATLNDRAQIQKLLASSLLSDLIHSKILFKKNALIAEFLQIYFDIELSKSAIGSRTVIAGRIFKHISAIDDEGELISLLNTLYKIISKIKNEADIMKKDAQDVIRGIKL